VLLAGWLRGAVVLALVCWCGKQTAALMLWAAGSGTIG
jgi:hypothetical protein